MFLIQINAQSVDRFFEVLPGEKENAELMVEDLVSHILLEHFEEVIVDCVTLDLSRDQARERFYWSIFGEAYCTPSSSAYSEHKLKSLELVLMERFSASLVELFGKISAGSITIRSASCEHITFDAWRQI